jgi:plastocyanin
MDTGRTRVAARSAIVAAALALALVGAACSNGYGNGAAAGSPSPSPSHPVTSPSSTGGGSGGYGGYGGGSNRGGGGGEDDGGNGGGRPSATVTQADYSFTPSKFSVKSGAIVEVTNSTSSTPHTFTIDGEDVNVNVDPGSSETVTLDLTPGTYPFFCRYHASMGMTGTLTVT